MRFAALLFLSALLTVGCNRDAFKDTQETYTKPLDRQAIESTNGLDPNARFDLHEARPPSEIPGARGSSRQIEIQDPAGAVGPSVREDNPSQ
ncbi:MAG: hypothetical protein ACK4UN_19475 [Limisphaerales bacterium]